MALAKYVASTRFEDLPADVLTMTKYSILDAIGVSMAASGLEAACRPFIDTALGSGSAEQSVVMGTGARTSMIMAALANGALAHALDYEDAHDPSRTHPNAATVAAAISIADATTGISGKQFMLAVALGCDVTCRLSMAQGNVNELPKAFYPPAIVGTFGATASASRLLGLTPEQTLNAFSLALGQNSCSAEILFDAYSDIRAVRDSFCAQTGVQAAQLAKRGVKGFQRPIEGQGGFFAMYAQGQQVPGLLTRELGVRFEGRNVGFKAWPACRDTHLYIQAILEGMQREPVAVDQIVEVRAFVNESNLIVCEPAGEKRRPRGAIDAKFSLYFTLASALLHRDITLRSYTTEALAQADVLQLAQKVHYTLDASRTRLDGRETRDLLEVRLRDGSTRRWGVRHLYGSPENPLAESALVSKFIDCGLAARKPQRTTDLQALARQILSLEEVADMKSVTRFL